MRTTLTLLLSFVFVHSAFAQHAEQEVRAVLDTLFEGMIEANAEKVASVFADGATLTSSSSRNGMPITQTSQMEQFIAAVGQAEAGTWDERIWNVQIDVRDNLASAWMDYAFYFSGNLSHCGVNSVQLARQPDGAWRAIALADSRTPAAECEPDPDIIEESAVRLALMNYLRGHATGEGSHHERVFNSVATLYWMRDGTLNERSSEEYIAGAPGTPPADEADRFRYIDWVDVSGSAAVARIVLDYPTAYFVDYMSLLKIEGRWQIVNKIFDVQPVDN